MLKTLEKTDYIIPPEALGEPDLMDKKMEEVLDQFEDATEVFSFENLIPVSLLDPSPDRLQSLFPKSTRASLYPSKTWPRYGVCFLPSFHRAPLAG